MQDIGEKEINRLSAALERRRSVESRRSEAEDYSRLVRDLVSKGIVRTALESVQLSLHSNHPDDFMAECIRNFPTVTFPASLLLKREEIETGKRSGASIISSVTHGSGKATYMFTGAPFDLLYGFRGALHEVDLSSPYEMLLHWSLERITAPISALGIQRATWTEEASTYRRQCREAGETPAYKAGIHDIAAAGVGRILMEDLSQLRGLRHVWCELRKRVHIPTWSFAKVPRSAFSPEENARLFSLCVHAALDLGYAPRFRHESFALELGPVHDRLA